MNRNATSGCNDCAFGFEAFPECFCSRHVLAVIQIGLPLNTKLESLILQANSLSSSTMTANALTAANAELLRAAQSDFGSFLENLCSSDYNDINLKYLTNATIYQVNGTIDRRKNSATLNFALDANVYASPPPSCGSLENYTNCVATRLTSCPQMTKFSAAASAATTASCNISDVVIAVASPCGTQGCAAAKDENGVERGEGAAAPMWPIIVGILAGLLLCILALFLIRKYPPQFVVNSKLGQQFLDGSKYTKSFSLGQLAEEGDVDASQMRMMAMEQNEDESLLVDMLASGAAEKTAVGATVAGSTTASPSGSPKKQRSVSFADYMHSDKPAASRQPEAMDSLLEEKTQTRRRSDTLDSFAGIEEKLHEANLRARSDSTYSSL